MLEIGQIDLSQYLKRNPEDYSTEWYSGSGAGGQHRNKHMNSARITHIPTGIIRSAQTRSRQNSLQEAMTAINEELDRLCGKAAGAAENNTRRNQIGNGERSDKRRTVRFQDGSAIDHITGKRVPIEVYMKGGMDKLW